MSKKFFFLPALLGAFVLIMGACTESDPCKDVECGTNGTCFEGDCICDVGYQQDVDGMCTVRTVDLFAGSFVANDNCSASGVSSYNVSILEAGVSSVTITNFWGVFVNQVNATIDDNNNITIARQEPDGDAFYIEGTGTLSVDGNGKSTITLNFTVSDETDPMNINSDSCSSTFTEV